MVVTPLGLRSSLLSGVPQGSVLGPLLFLIFVRDLPDWVKNSIMMFADDTKVWTSIHKLEDQESLQRDLERLGECKQASKLPFIRPMHASRTHHNI